MASLTPLEPAAVEVYAHASRTTSIGLPDLVRLTGRPEDELPAASRRCCGCACCDRRGRSRAG
ncbi:hypothetical protein [Streptomyces buecherae]|uniref:hypothetical protein n=1 Tax=Streptomyces buecherae TaxID=2763006 RepID=UPI00365B7C69